MLARHHIKINPVSVISCDHALRAEHFAVFMFFFQAAQDLFNLLFCKSMNCLPAPACKHFICMMMVMMFMVMIVSAATTALPIMMMFMLVMVLMVMAMSAATLLSMMMVMLMMIVFFMAMVMVFVFMHMSAFRADFLFQKQLFFQRFAVLHCLKKLLS